MRGSHRITVVSWNTAVGDGDLTSLLRDLRNGAGGDTPIVLLLQEVYRKSADLPRPGRDAAFASRLGRTTPARARQDVVAVGSASGLNVYYVPSMRNGSPPESDEDRGNAILSTLPLDDLAAIEMPYEEQRRVAVAATISGVGSDGAPWSVRVVSAHLDNVVGLRRLWVIGSPAARTRQARGLVAHLEGDTSVILGADFNSWYGFQDPAYRVAAQAFGATTPDDRRRTFHGLMRLDHLFFMLASGWRATFTRGGSRYGSDHYPLIATVDLP